MWVCVYLSSVFPIKGVQFGSVPMLKLLNLSSCSCSEFLQGDESELVLTLCLNSV